MACSHIVAGEVACKSGSATMERIFSPGLQQVILTRSTHQEIFLTAELSSGQTAADLFRATAARLGKLGARVVCLDVFGLDSVDALPDLCNAFGEVEFPVTWLEEGCDAPAPRAGLELWAVTELAVEPIRVDGRVVGTLFEDGCIRVCRLGGLGLADPGQGAEAQAHFVFEQMSEILGLAGMNFANVVRTWFFNHRILDWYGGFNTVRTTFFKENQVFEGLVPASTGVGGRNLYGSALIAGLLAIEPLCDATKVFAVPSPLQCPALEYGSSFSRAAEIAMPDHRRLLISGTASIAPEGHTVHVGNVDKQLELSLDVVQAILESRGMGWGDVTRATGYFKHIEDAPAFGRWLADRDVAPFPILLAKEDICRDDLLFEIELDAMKVC